MNTPSPAREPVEQLAEEFVERLRRGERPSIGEYVERHPHLADEIRSLFPMLAEVEDLALEPPRPQTPAVPTIRETDESVTAKWPVIPGYELVQELGKGGMGVVYRARHLALGREVALKMILGHGSPSAEERARFRREAEAVARLSHPHVVQIHDVGEYQDNLYLTLEYLESGSLARRLNGVPLSANEAAGLLEPLARAVHAAHETGIVHRDLKPANILLTAEGTPKVADFGLARLEGEESLSATDAVMGTPQYMAPEQAGGRREEIGPWTDVYGLGAILYECLTGRPPFRGPTAIDTLYQVKTQEPASPSSLQPQLPRDLETICLKCLQKDPTRRYASAAALADDLGRFLRGEPTLARPAPVWERVLKWARRRPAVAGMLGTAAAAIVAVIVLQALSNARLAEAKQTIETKQGETMAALEGEQDANQERDEANADLREAIRREYRMGYLQRIALSSADWQAGRVALAENRLDSCIPREGPPDPLRPDLRGWEWHFLKRLCHADRATLVGHAGNVQEVAYSPDGTLIASGGDDGTVRLWDARRGTPRNQFLTHRRGNMMRIAFSPDSKRVASLHGQGALHIHDTAKGALVSTPSFGFVEAFDYSPDGRHLAVAIRQGKLAEEKSLLQLRDAASGKGLLTLAEKQDPIKALVFSPNGQRLVALQNGTAVVWDVAARKVDSRVRPSVGGIRGAAFSGDGSLLAVTTGGLSASIWDFKNKSITHTLWGHFQDVYGVAFSPIDMTVATASRDSTIRLWNATTGAAVGILRGHRGFVYRVAFSPDGKTLASCSTDDTVKLWPVEESQESRVVLQAGGNQKAMTWSAHGGQIALAGVGTVLVFDRITQKTTRLVSRSRDIYHDVAFFGAQDRYLAACGGAEKTPDSVKIWDVLTQQMVREFPCTAELIRNIAITRDGTRLAAAADGKAITLWDLSTGAIVGRLDAGRAPFGKPAFSPDGSRLAVVNEKGFLHVWDVSQGLEVLRLGPLASGVRSMAFHPEGQLLASGSPDGTIRLWDLTTGKETLARNHQNQIFGLTFSPDGRLLVSSDMDGLIKVWSVPKGEELLTLAGDKRSIEAVAFSPDGLNLASLGIQGDLRLWDGRPWEAEKPTPAPEAVLPIALTVPAPGSFRALALSPDNRFLVTAGWDNRFSLRNAVNGTELRTLDGLDPPGGCVGFSLDGRLVAAGAIGPDNKTPLNVGVWEVESGRLKYTLKGHSGWIAGIAFAPDGRHLASAGRDQVIRVWDLSTGVEVQAFRGPNAGVLSLAYSPDGRTCAAGYGRVSNADGRTARLWDTATGKERRVLRGHAGAITFVSFSPDGSRLVTTSPDGTVRFWNVDTGELIPPELKPANGARFAFFDAVGHLLTVSSNGVASVWNPTTGQRILEFSCSGNVAGAALSPDGRRLVTGGTKLRIWDLSPIQKGAERPPDEEGKP